MQWYSIGSAYNALTNNCRAYHIYPDTIYKLVERGYIVPKRFTYRPPIDPDLPAIKSHWLRTVANQVLRPSMRLGNWVVVAHTTNMTLNDWLSLDEVQQEAVALEVQDFLKEREKKNKEAMDQFKSQIDSVKPHRSVFEGIPMPSVPNR